MGTSLPPPPPPQPPPPAHGLSTGGGSARATGSTALRITAGAVVTIGQLAWALAITMIAAATDGVPADDYSTPNRAAFGFLLIGLAVVLPPTACLTFTIATLAGSRLAVAMAVAQLPALAALALVLAFW